MLVHVQHADVCLWNTQSLRKGTSSRSSGRQRVRGRVILSQRRQEPRAETNHLLLKVQLLGSGLQPEGLFWRLKQQAFVRVSNLGGGDLMAVRHANSHVVHGASSRVEPAGDGDGSCVPLDIKVLLLVATCKQPTGGQADEGTEILRVFISRKAA